MTITIHKVDMHLCTEGVDCTQLMSNTNVGAQLFQRTVRDQTIVQHAQEAINGIPRGETELQLRFENGLCDNLPGDAIYVYDFRFTWHGIATQEAVVNSWCPDWHITTLGVPGVFSHMDRGALPQVATMADMPLTP